MKCIVTTTAKQKNAKRHIFGRYDSLKKAKTDACNLINRKYIVEIYNGKWELISRRCVDDNMNLYMEDV
jgi:hypothetical protein